MTDVRVKLNGQGAKGRAVKGIFAGLAAAAEHILAESNKRVPLEEGTLERSGVVTVDRESRTAAVSYDTPYAVRQHEELTWRHDPGRSAKYLELTLAEHGDTALRLMAARIQRSIGRPG